MRLIPIVVGGLAGGVVGYFVGVFISCDWLYPTSNLCGIWGLMYTAPIGLVVGALIGWMISRRRQQ